MRLHGKRFFTRRANGAGWVYGEDERFWGVYGAAGALLRLGEGEDALYLLLQRSYQTHYGGSWGIPGGAIARDEEPVEAALRELHEETGLILPSSARLVDAVRYSPVPDWSYTTFTFQLDSEPQLDPFLSEHLDAIWVTRAEAATLLLHPMFAGPFLRGLVG